MNASKYERIGDLTKIINNYPVESIINLRIKEQGRDKYICPFHDDHTPNNFKIRKQKNMFWCYACGTHGDGIKFIEYYDGISWKEAVVQIALELNLIAKDEYDNLLSNNNELEKNNFSTKIFVPVEENRAAKITELSSRDIIDKVYSIFVKGYSLMGKPKLTDDHTAEIVAKRNLSMDEIENDGYFTFPNIDFLDTFIKELEKENIPIEVLKGVPGFYYSKQKERWAFTVLRGTSGIGIPIKGIDNKIEGIQIRLDKLSENKKRYQWFSSSFAGGDGSTGAKNIYGTSPGTPVAVVRPKQIKNTSIFVTEGFFKARAISKQWQTISLSIQGVNNWKPIPYIIDELKEENERHKNLCIAFDSDMGRKETVLKPALQMGIAISGLELNEKLSKDLEIILKTGNRALSTKASFYRESATLIEKEIEKQTPNMIVNISYALWAEWLGKGIDDVINNGNGMASSTIRKMDLKDFFHNAFEMLCELDDIRERISIEQNLDFRKVAIPDETKLLLYEKYIENKLKK